MTEGTNYNIPCPNCGKINHYVTQGITVGQGKITEFSRGCTYCKEMIYYWAEWSITLRASKLSEVD